MDFVGAEEEANVDGFLVSIDQTSFVQRVLKFGELCCWNEYWQLAPLNALQEALSSMLPMM